MQKSCYFTLLSSTDSMTYAAIIEYLITMLAQHFPRKWYVVLPLSLKSPYNNFPENQLSKFGAF